ncbi:elongation of very long chain fatty acids protein AAEL008004-like [Pseudomyrmex gracilis]|uniref:elongation of very long chain fatty acids protein AAEL008004-like n=1 Tax=Pseudomyrmex gracilis TaxID=219809 RepID=UPI00099543B2|nr:elongation of very long chain fatty acids protein AAEL008004-like [Pseudomyrmex gracilis]XP_020296942.1 elongation of very long chain fatty acids protein AAEL008004-like [Pseudomyrmex gracilis]
MSVSSVYDYLMIDLADPFTRNWALVETPFLVIIITFGYLYFVFYAGPSYMKNRQSFNLRIFILFYNVFQILANAWLVHSYVSAGWFTKYSIKCSNNYDLTSINGFKLLSISWWLFILKLIDYIETCVFVLRKKQNQVSSLHVYHHVSNVLFGWYFLKYIADPRATFVCLVNCFIHVIMYTYYFIAAWSTTMQQKVSRFKPYITKLQMTQFVALICYGLQAFLDPECKGSQRAKELVFVFVLNMLLFLYLFYDFHKKTYGTKQKQKTAKHEE